MGRYGLKDGSVNPIFRQEMPVGEEYPAGLKWTRQRKAVYGILRQAQEPLTAAGIYHLAQKIPSGEEYALSTIYRILTAFEEKGLVEKEVFMEDGTAVYALSRGGHTHYAVCLECHRRIPLPNCPFAHMHLEKDTGDFTITNHKLELYGYCKDCKEAGKMREES
ncbi:MAG: Fur family transcriptional regulator [Acetatifactor sp.]